MAIDIIGKPLKVRGKVFFKLKSTYYTNLKLREWLNSCNNFKKITFKSCKYTFAANYLLESEGFKELFNDSKPSLNDLSKIKSCVKFCPAVAQAGDFEFMNRSF